MKVWRLFPFQKREESRYTTQDQNGLKKQGGRLRTPSCKQLGTGIYVRTGVVAKVAAVAAKCNRQPATCPKKFDVITELFKLEPAPVN